MTTNGRIEISWDTQEIQTVPRSEILAFEALLAAHPNASFGDNPQCPLKHSFGGGIYMREIVVPKGTVLVGKIHRHDHPNVLLEGEVLVVTEAGGKERLKAPIAMISPAGCKRAVVALTDTRWVTFHSVGEERDLDAIEKLVIAPSYEQLESERKEVSCRG